MKSIYIIEKYDCGRWSGFYAAGYFTSEKQANLFLTKTLAGLDPCKKDLYKIQRIQKKQLLKKEKTMKNKITGVYIVRQTQPAEYYQDKTIAIFSNREQAEKTFAGSK